MNNTDAPDYSPLAFGTGLTLGLILLLGLPRATNEPPTAPRVGVEGAAGHGFFNGEVGAQVAEMATAHRALALADPDQREENGL